MMIQFSKLACLVLPCSALVCLGLSWSALVCLGLPWFPFVCFGLPKLWRTLKTHSARCAPLKTKSLRNTKQHKTERGHKNTPAEREHRITQVTEHKGNKNTQLTQSKENTETRRQYKQCSGDSAVETVLWKQCSGDSAVEAVQWRQFCVSCVFVCSLPVSVFPVCFVLPLCFCVPFLFLC